MTIKQSIRGAIMAGAAVGLLACAPSGSTDTPRATGSKVKCSGINACAGKGKCGGATHDCAGKNSCKGKGWIKVSAKDCTDRGGKAI